MQRRDFLRVTLSAGGGALLLSAGAGCQPQLKATAGWQGPPPDMADVRLRLLAYGLLAPSAHNSQPWLVELLDGASFHLRVDPDRLLPQTDPQFRQTTVSQGTFLEQVALAAAAEGQRATITLFPDGEPAPTVPPTGPVARVELVADPTAQADALFAVLRERQSNKQPYAGPGPTAADMTALRGASGANFSFITQREEPRTMATLAGMLTEAMRIEVSSDARNRETIRWFRFDDDEIEAHRDGFGLRESGMGPMMKWIAETFFISRSKAETDPRSFGEESIDLTRKQVESAQAFAWITTRGNTRRDQVLAGRDYARIQLMATRLGLAMHPLSQILEEYSDMLPLQAEFLDLAGVPRGHTVQMLFRLGHADPYPHAPRRPVSAILQG